MDDKTAVEVLKIMSNEIEKSKRLPAEQIAAFEETAQGVEYAQRLGRLYCEAIGAAVKALEC